MRLPDLKLLPVLAVLALSPAVAHGAQTKAPAARPAPTPSAPPATPAAPAVPRVIYKLEQMQTGPLSPAIMAKLQPLNTIQQVEDLLKSNEIAFAWRRAEVPSDTMPPDLARQLAGLPPHEVFVVSGAQAVLIGVILSSH